MENKGQSALEYLMTYGWALVVIVIVIAALFAFGIFNPPSAGTCTGLDKLAYEDHGYDSTTFSISVRNGTGSSLSTFSAVLNSEVSDMNVDATAWNLGDRKVFTYPIADLTSPATINFEYETSSGITHTETASCSFSN
ncbi:MAG: hypothetical protein JW703_04040 [Candidatus Diapherotrites archaeon]|nr:hypothetical protein [Candidatus Diapherotrites archaeon]